MTRSSDKAGLSMQSQALRYAMLSAVSFVGNLGLLFVLHEWIGISSYIAVPIAALSMTLFNFVTLRLVIFEATDRGLAKELAGFLASIALFRVAEYAAFVSLHGLLGMTYLYAYALVLVVSAVSKFLFMRSVLFAIKPSPPSTSPAGLTP